MPRTRPSLALAGIAAALSLSLVAVGPAQAATSKVTACVNKQTGATKVLLGKKAKKKCAKGWTKVTWNTKGTSGKNGTNGATGPGGATGATGAAGANGASAPILNVHNADGSVLGALAGVFPLSDTTPIVFVLVQGGIYTYLMSGPLYPPTSSSPVFLDNTCSGTAYTTVATMTYPILVGPLVGGPSRIAFRSSSLVGSNLVFGATRAWSYTAGHSTIPGPPPPAYQLSYTGACASAPAVLKAGDQLVTLQSVPAPPDGVGPLTIS